MTKKEFRFSRIQGFRHPVFFTGLLAPLNPGTFS